MVFQIGGGKPLSRKAILEMAVRSRRAIPELIKEVSSRQHESEIWLRLDMAGCLYRRNPLSVTDEQAAAMAIGYLVVDSLYCILRNKGIISYTVDQFDGMMFSSPTNRNQYLASHLSARIHSLLYKSVVRKIDEDVLSMQEIKVLSDRADKSWIKIFDTFDLLIKDVPYNNRSTNESGGDLYLLQTRIAELIRPPSEEDIAWAAKSLDDETAAEIKELGLS